MSEDKFVTISEWEYLRLTRASAELEVLYGFGVDNWSGYADAMQALKYEESQEAS